MSLFKPTCSAPHPANSEFSIDPKFCSRAQNHTGSHWVVIDGTKYFW